MSLSEFHDEYSESLETDFRKLEGAFVSDTVKLLAPSEPIKLPEHATVHEAIAQMAEKRRAAVVVVDADGRLSGIFTERDLLRRVAVPGRDPRQTRLSEVMTRDPEALVAGDLICYAINRLHNAGYRTLPLVDAERRPIGVMTVNDIVQWLAELFPEAIVNLRPGGKLKRPQETDAG
ncbi:MAG TPA: CBS domain-containing protein [Methylomirabilota bacterium]|jgi:CBS domain-containing protein|nr:CBS domain-containing protein [Methylomirabilota bacterium]